MIIGLDPSFTNTGVAIIDSDKASIEFAKYGKEIGDKTFVNLRKSAQFIMDSVMPLIPEHSFIITETPPPTGQFSSGLFGLDILLTTSILINRPTVELYGVSPSYVGHIHGKKSYKKSESVAICKDLLSIFQNHGYTVPKSRISNDQAEAFIFACRLFIKLNIDNRLAKELISYKNNYKNEKEFRIYG